jgi:hypothetical protein
MQTEEPNKSGNNILQKIDYNQLSRQFIEYFYNTWQTNPFDFIAGQIFTEYSRLQVDINIYKYNDIVTYLNNIKTSGSFKVEISKMNCMDSGSRRIDILVNGIFHLNNNKHIFSQSFLITYVKDAWKFQNSILNIFI